MTSKEISNQILQQEYLYLQQMRERELKQQQQSNQDSEDSKNDSEDRNDWIQLIRYKIDGA